MTAPIKILVTGATGHIGSSTYLTLAAQPDRYDDRKVFRNSSLEFQRPGRADIVGFVLSCLGVVGVILLALWVANLGA